jgi:hypothetical protein
MTTQSVATTGARANVTPPAVATIFPPLRKPRKTGRQCPSIAAAPARIPTVSPPTRSPTSAGTNPLATSSIATGRP